MPTHSVPVSFAPAKPLEIDRFLAAIIRGEAAAWRFGHGEDAAAEVGARVRYHGLSGLLNEMQAHLDGWPSGLKATIRDQALARSMWELRHRAVIADLCTRLDHAGVDSLILKGTALAYDIYSNPAVRERSDSDLLVSGDDRTAARIELAEAGFAPVPSDGMADDLRAQESWRLTASDGTDHVVDLHWTVMNYPAFDRIVTNADFAAGKRPLPRLGPRGMAPSRAMLLLHACLHRQAHIQAPYFVDGIAHYGGDRLIWLVDIARLCAVLDARDWAEFTEFAEARRLAPPCRDGLDMAAKGVDARVPADVMAGLARGGDRSPGYFERSAVRRAFADLRAIDGGTTKLRYLKAKLLPGANFIRGKYPDMAERPLAQLYLRRLVEFLSAGRA